MKISIMIMTPSRKLFMHWVFLKEANVNAIMFFVMFFTVIQFFVCKFSLWWIIAVIIRLLFLARIMGVTINVKKLAIAEGVVFGIRVLYNLVMHSKAIPWLSLGFNLVFILVIIGLEFLDTIMYVYLIEDEED